MVEESKVEEPAAMDVDQNDIEPKLELFEESKDENVEDREMDTRLKINSI